MFAEYDTVISTRKLANNINKGTIGAILISFDDGKHFEVEFINEYGFSLGTLTVSNKDIERYEPKAQDSSGTIPMKT